MIRFFLYFIISFTILSVPIKNRKLFYHLDEVAYPVTKHIIKKGQEIAKTTFGNVKIWGVQLIDDNKKIVKQGMDQVSAKSSAPSRNMLKFKQPKKVESQLDRKSEVLGVEYYSKEELEKLQNMLKESEY